MADATTSIHIARAVADTVLASHDGDIALYLIYTLAHPDSSAEDAARDLFWTRGRVANAAEILERICPDRKSSCGTSSSPVPSDDSQSRTSEPAEQFPEYTPEEISRRGNSDPDFKAIVSEAKRITGGALNESFLRVLFGIYDYLAMPPEVIFVLLHYCGEIVAGLPRRRVLSPRDVEREAYRWYNAGIMNLEAAEEYIARQKERRSAVGRIKAVLNISGRNLVTTENQYIQSWLDMGFSEDAIGLAYDRTVTNTGALKWNYMDKILRSWHDKHLHRLEEIQSGDSSKRPSSGSSGSAISGEELLSMLEKLQDS